MSKKIVDVLEYDFTPNGGMLTLKFDDGWITKRKFTNVRVEKSSKVCALSGKTIGIGHIACYVSIKKAGYPRYWLRQETINEALVGVSTNNINQKPIVKAILTFLDECKEIRKKSSEEEKVLREGLQRIKFNNSQTGKRMTAAHKLLELVSKE